METPLLKNEIVRAVQELPEDATVEDAMERLYFLAKIERGLEQSESDETISHDEIKARFIR
jgi:hypothetical protein